MMFEQKSLDTLDSFFNRTYFNFIKQQVPMFTNAKKEKFERMISFEKADKIIKELKKKEGIL